MNKFSRPSIPVAAALSWGVAMVAAWLAVSNQPWALTLLILGAGMLYLRSRQRVSANPIWVGTRSAGGASGPILAPDRFLAFYWTQIFTWKSLIYLVELIRIELTTSSLRTRRSPN